MPRQRRAGGGIDRLPSGQYRVRIVTADGRRLSLGTYPTKRAAETAYTGVPQVGQKCRSGMLPLAATLE